jgi:antitoxin component HigA of HigAB toxin-antitoxin module
MAVVVDPELGVPVPPDTPYVDLRERVEAACNAAIELSGHGLDLEPTKEDMDTAAAVTAAYAEAPEKTSKKVGAKNLAMLTPPSIVLINGILQEFGRSVAESAAQIRYTVTNKLLMETDNPDPRVRIRALELLGKISDVGLFAEKSEVTITHQTTDELRERLRMKLAKIINSDGEEQDPSPVVIDGEVIDVDAELGLKDKDNE